MIYWLCRFLKNKHRLPQQQLGLFNHGHQLQKTIDPSKIPLLHSAAIELYAAAVLQDINHEQRTLLKQTMMAQCEGVDWTDLNQIEKVCLYAEETKQGNFEAAKNLSNCLITSNGPLFAALNDRFGSTLCQVMETTQSAKFHELLDIFEACAITLSSANFTNASCALLNRLGGLSQTKANNKAACQALDAIKSHYFEGSTEATPEQTLKVMAALAQNMGKLHAAKLLSGPQTIASGGLARSQDPQTKAYKLIKQYLVKQTDKSGQLKMEFLKNLWAGDAIGQFSDASRSLSGAHWKKLSRLWQAMQPFMVLAPEDLSIWLTMFQTQSRPLHRKHKAIKLN